MDDWKWLKSNLISLRSKFWSRRTRIFPSIDSITKNIRNYDVFEDFWTLIFARLEIENYLFFYHFFQFGVSDRNVFFVIYDDLGPEKSGKMDGRGIDRTTQKGWTISEDVFADFGPIFYLSERKKHNILLNFIESVFVVDFDKSIIMGDNVSV